VSRYRKIDPRIWNDAKFRELSDQGKLAFLFILTHPHMTSLGAMRGSLSGLATELGWSEKAFRDAFGEAFAKGMLEHDEKASFVGVPNFLRYNGPESPNVVKSWVAALDLIPECALKSVLLQRVKRFTEGLSEGFGKALPEVFRKAMPKQEQEQEPEHEPEQEECRAQKRAFGVFVRLTNEEHAKLVERFGDHGTADRIEALDHYLGSRGRRYKSHYHTILAWERRNSDQKHERGSHANRKQDRTARCPIYRRDFDGADDGESIVVGDDD